MSVMIGLGLAPLFVMVGAAAFIVAWVLWRPVPPIVAWVLCHTGHHAAGKSARSASRWGATPVRCRRCRAEGINLFRGGQTQTIWRPATPPRAQARLRKDV